MPPSVLQFSGMPRSGSQWLHRLLWQLHEARALNVGNKHGHAPYGDMPGISSNRPMIGIYRDLRDVIVSAYYLNERRKEHGLPAHKWINALTDGKTIDEGIRAMCEYEDQKVLRRYLAWFQSYWGKPHCLLLRFEDTVHRRGAVYEALAGLGFDIPFAVYSDAWEAVAYKRMRKAHPEHYRTGGQSTWREVLEPDTIRFIERECAWFFDRAEYPLMGGA